MGERKRGGRARGLGLGKEGERKGSRGKGRGRGRGGGGGGVGYRMTDIAGMLANVLSKNSSAFGECVSVNLVLAFSLPPLLPPLDPAWQGR